MLYVVVEHFKNGEPVSIASEGLFVAEEGEGLA